MNKEDRKKTISRWFYDDEIKYKTSTGIIYLKQGIKRSPQSFFNWWDETEESASRINRQRIFQDKIERAVKLRQEENDYN